MSLVLLQRKLALKGHIAKENYLLFKSIFLSFRYT